MSNRNKLLPSWYLHHVSDPDPYYPVGSDCILYLDFGDGLESAVDHSTYTHNGTITGATFETLGLTFDGLDDKVTTATISETASIEHWSLYYWVYPISNPAPVGIFMSQAGSNTGFWTTSTNAFYYLNEAYGYPSEVPLLIPTATWTLIQLIYDGTALAADRLKLYLNSSQQGLSVVGTIPTTMSTQVGVWYIGVYTDGSSYPMNMTVGQVLMFTSTRTDMVAYWNATKARYGL